MKLTKENPLALTKEETERFRAIEEKKIEVQARIEEIDALITEGDAEEAALYNEIAEKYDLDKDLMNFVDGEPGTLVPGQPCNCPTCQATKQLVQTLEALVGDANVTQLGANQLDSSKDSLAVLLAGMKKPTHC